MPVALAAASIAGPIVGGVIGNMASKGDRNKAEAAMKEAISIIDSVGAPPDLSARIVLEKLNQVGVLTPEMEHQINLGFSKVAQIQEDPALKKAQTGALQLLQSRGQTGLGPEDRAALNEVRRQVAADTESKRQQILQNMQQRGMGGSGAELAAQLQGAQAGAEQASRAGDEIASQASQRALQAMSSAGQLGGQIRAQDFDVNQARSAAEDAVNQFNVQQQIGQQQRNVGARNTASGQNLSEAQRVSDTNKQMENQESYRQAEAKRQNWLDTLGLAQARSSARGGQQQFYSDQAKQTAQMWGNIGGGAGQAAGAAYGKTK